ncbi:TlpA family protein disulfide reductase [Actinocatenispora comari]|nr:thioredoxin family protein [Actinocatenispora comari]
MPSWMTGLVVAVVVLAAATVVGLLWQRRNGRLRAVEGGGPVPEQDAEAGVLARLGVPADAPVTLLQFSSAFCAPCRATRRICAEVSERLDGVVHLEVDAESHLDEVRALNVLRTPTLFVIGAGRQIVQRASGAPTKPQLIAAVAPLLTEPAGAGQSS